MGVGHTGYLEDSNKALKMLKDGKVRVLKMDIMNEVTLRHPEPGGILLNLKRDPSTIELHAVEYDPEKIHIGWYMQLEHFVKFIRADMRHLPYRDRTFDLLLDLSTLDHIPLKDIELAIAGYARVLKDEGLLVLFCWCMNVYTIEHVGPGMDKWHFDNQYYYPLEDLREILKRYFNLIEEEKGPVYEGKKFMQRFLGGKKFG